MIARNVCSELINHSKKKQPIQQDQQNLEQRSLAIGLNKYFIVGRYISINIFSDYIWAGNIF
jgi:hypothetical protein